VGVVVGALVGAVETVPASFEPEAPASSPEDGLVPPVGDEVPVGAEGVVEVGLDDGEGVEE
jgi:hypothetical protein